MKKHTVLIFSVLFSSSIILAHAGHEHHMMDHILAKYLEIQQALANDSMNGVNEAAKEIQKHCFSLGGEEKKFAKDIVKATGKLAASKDLESARSAFEQLSGPVVAWVKTEKPKGIEVYTCSMKKTSWAQKSGEAKNPFYGKKMQSCGEKAS